MQVSQQDDFITHAVIGNQETISMGISDGAALMHILSSTLYTYPKLAVVREVICNAWDAHIASGQTDKPIQITMNSGSITVRDFGFGIAHKDIGPIYGVYGNSTKRDDSESTGGFGLGSKAPFAYTDNFEVTSHHLGLKTIYRVSKSSMEKDGKPSINKIMALPTDESGIAVRFDLQVGDMPGFKKLIEEVLYLGEIKASINEQEPQESLPLSQSPTGYIITGYTGTLTHGINVRYGNVVYPVPAHEAYQQVFTKIVHALSDLWQNANIIFMAPPDSISIAPSREAVILTDATVATIKGLLENFSFNDLKLGGEAVTQIRNAKANRLLHETSEVELIKLLTDENELVIRPDDATADAAPYAFTARKAAVTAGLLKRNRLSSETAFQKTLNELIRRQAVCKPLAKAVLKSGVHKDFWKRLTKRTVKSLAFRHHDYPLSVAMAHPDLKDCKTQVFANCGWYTGTWESSFAGAYQQAPSLAALVQRKAVVARNRADVREHMIEQYRNKSVHVFMVYVGNNKHSEARADLATQILQKKGYQVEQYFPEREKKERAPRTTPVKRRAKGTFLPLSTSLDSAGKYFLLSTARANAKDDQLISEPIAWTQLHNKSECPQRIEYLSEKISHFVFKKWGDQIAVVTGLQAEALTKKGIKSVSKFLKEYVDNTLSQTADIKRYAAFAMHFTHSYCPVRGVAKTMVFHEDFMKSVGLRFHILQENALLIKFCEELDHTWRDFPKTIQAMKQVAKHPKAEEVLNKMLASPWRRFVDLSKVQYDLEHHTPGSDQCQIPYEILRNLLK